MMLRLRGRLPVQLLSRDNSMRTLMAELSRGATVGLGSDVRLDGGEMIPFFGHDDGDATRCPRASRCVSTANWCRSAPNGCRAGAFGSRCMRR